MQTDVAKLIGCTLTDVRVRTFCVEFVFSKTLTILVRVKKKLKFALRPGDELSYDPTLTTHDLSIESPKFIFLQGLRCSRVDLGQGRFDAWFVGEARLWVDFGEADFEPLEFVGLAGERHEKMEFYYVL